MLRTAAILIMLAVILASTSQPALAADVRGDDMVVIDAGTTIDDDLYLFGNAVEIHGTVNGDVISGASTVTIDGTVNGDVIASAGTIQIPGDVQGSIRAAGGNLSIGGTVGDDVLVAGGTLTVSPEARIGRDVLFSGGSLTLNGQTARDVRVAAGNLTIGGQVDGNVRAEVTQLSLADGAVVSGNLVYTSEQAATIAEGARVGGETERLASAEPVEPTVAERVLGVLTGWLRLLVAMLLVGLTLVLVFPAFSRRAANSLGTAPWPSIGVGVALFIGLPILALAVLVVGIFVGGWWLAPILLGLYAAMLVFGLAVVGLFAGRTILAQAGRGNLHQVAGLALGLVILTAIFMVPILGWVIGIVAAVAGLGALGRALWLTQHHGQMAPA